MKDEITITFSSEEQIDILIALQMANGQLKKDCDLIENPLSKNKVESVMERLTALYRKINKAEG